MGLSLTEFLGILDETIATAEASRKRKRALVLPLTVPVVLGEQGVRLRDDPEVGKRFGFTLAQCRRMRETILAAAREEARASGLDPTR
jgi:hypothetical protein